MRVTNQIITRNSQARLQSGLLGVDRLREDISSGIRIRKMSDDPTSAGEVVRVGSSMRAIAQFRRNIDLGVARASAEETALNSVTDSLGRAIELGVAQSSATGNAQSRLIVKAEVDTLLKFAVDLGNTSPGTRAGFRFVGNRNVGPGVFKKTSIWPAVVRTVSWDELDIRDNVQAVDPVTMPTAVRFDGVAPVSALVTGNCWANAPDDQCMK